MASLKEVSGKKGETWHICFRFEGVNYTGSCHTSRRAVAKRLLGKVDETIALLHTGRLELPDDVNAGDWILGGGKAKPRQKRKSRPIDQRIRPVTEDYLKDQVRKAPSTIAGEKIHIARLVEILGPGMPLSQVDLEELKRYASRRGNSRYHGKLVSGTTIRKELMTFRQIWLWAKQNGRVAIGCPLYDEDGTWQIPLPKPAEGKRFQTWRQIRRQIAVGDLSDDEQAELWQGLYLDSSQVKELLDHVEENARHDFMFPMFAFVAYTGCRRSEMRRALLMDIDFDDMQVMLRERKRRKDLSSSIRVVPLHERLAEIFEAWVENHPGGKHLLSTPLDMPCQPLRTEHTKLSVGQARTHFRAALKDSKWSVVPGFHVLRHSFGANLARSGRVSESTIGNWMGHTTQEMRELYQHLFPQDGASQISELM